MSALLSLLRAARGEQGRGRADRWRQAVTQALGYLLSTQSSAFLQLVRQVTDQAAVGLNTDIVLNSISATRNITADTGTGIITLDPARVYRLSAGLAADSFSDATGGVLDVQFVDGSNNPLGSTARLRPMTGTGTASSLGVCEAIVSGVSQAKLRVVAATGTASILIGSYASVQKLSD